MIADTSEVLFAAWRAWVERFPSKFEPAHHDLRFACAGIPVALFNCGYPRRAVGRGELLGFIRDFSGILGRWEVPGLLMVRVGHADLPPDLTPVVRMPGMVARELRAPKHAMPEVEVKEVRGERMAEEIARLNVQAHGMPEAEIGPMTCAALWGAPNHGFLIYEDGKAVASGSATHVEGASYVGWMATDAEYRGRGYAEAILRHMDGFMRREYGVTESALHATESGQPVYARMGYRVVDEFVGYLCGVVE